MRPSTGSSCARRLAGETPRPLLVAAWRPVTHEALRSSLRKAHEWECPICVAGLDVETTSDQLAVYTVEDAMVAHQLRLR